MKKFVTLAILVALTTAGSASAAPCGGANRSYNCPPPSAKQKVKNAVVEKTKSMIFNGLVPGKGLLYPSRMGNGEATREDAKREYENRKRDAKASKAKMF